MPVWPSKATEHHQAKVEVPLLARPSILDDIQPDLDQEHIKVEAFIRTEQLHMNKPSSLWNLRPASPTLHTMLRFAIPPSPEFAV